MLVDEAIKLGKEISKFSLPVLLSCKESILKGTIHSRKIAHYSTLIVAEDLGLSQGVDYERKLFHSTFALVSTLMFY